MKHGRISELTKERAELHKTEREIADAEHRVGHQALLVEKLRSGGRETGKAELLLASMRELTSLLHEHRKLILQQIARLETRTIP